MCAIKWCIHTLCAVLYTVQLDCEEPKLFQTHKGKKSLGWFINTNYLALFGLLAVQICLMPMHMISYGQTLSINVKNERKICLTFIQCRTSLKIFSLLEPCVHSDRMRNEVVFIWSLPDVINNKRIFM